eukprot:TRINITY_DN493_c0_g1_i1.p2 TRINITY_DN493_c0_g1~~TRINITY_DN493_c0_g1_i1.p2  ORF type:complete len:127 (-),score=5.84 TRINITY_DN493_c0_g1_i1:756-1136(-)
MTFHLELDFDEKIAVDTLCSLRREAEISPRGPTHMDIDEEECYSPLPPQAMKRNFNSPPKPVPDALSWLPRTGCIWCGEQNSPVWRKGPDGKGQLCNACGLQHMRGHSKEEARRKLKKSRGNWHKH